MKEEAEKQNLSVEIPQNFYGLIAKKDEIKKETMQELDVSMFPATTALFSGDSYLQEFNAKVLGTIENYLILDQTVFYAASGGQAADTGMINGIEVIDVVKQKNVILHEMKKIEGFKKGQNVFGKIDWNRRYNLMKHHSAAHLLNAAARTLLGVHVYQAGSGKEPEKAHLDITHYKKLSLEELKKIELMVNELIQENHQIEVEFLPRTKAEQKYGFRLYQGGAVPGKELRVVHVKGIDAQACGGTHLKSTAEIGFFKILKRENVKDGVERITFSVGLPALKFIEKQEELLSESSGILGVPKVKLKESLNRIFNEWKTYRKELQKMQELVVERKEKELIEKSKKGTVKEYFEGVNSKTLIKLGEKIIQANPTATLFFGSKEEVIVMCGKKSGKNASELLRELFKKVKGKGGGRENLAQGKVEVSQNLKKELGG